MKTSAILRKAGDVLRARGWRQGVGELGNAVDGPVCALFAFPDRDYEQARDTLRVVIGGGLVSVWNDKYGRTADEVQIAMDAAYVLALQIEGDEPDDFEVL